MRSSSLSTIFVGLLALTATAAPSSGSAKAAVPFALSDAAASPAELVQRLLAALQKNDESALHALRVSEREYRELIAPGTVPEGQPPRQTDAKTSEFYWKVLDSKSRDLGRELLKKYGGQTLVFESFEFTKTPQQYAWYRAEGEVRVHVKNREGATATVPCGWVAEVDGRYKFIGINWND